MHASSIHQAGKAETYKKWNLEEMRCHVSPHFTLTSQRYDMIISVTKINGTGRRGTFSPEQPLPSPTFQRGLAVHFSSSHTQVAWSMSYRDGQHNSISGEFSPQRN
mmetsp:Transcript_47400/g.143484  ORF Transcript_47400/g.143484 Transcript_47400/m.143484 type:complete len:106 (-) Transcript_47400:1380-1697(-)